MFYPTTTGLWPNAYQIGAQPQTGMPAVYYQVPTVPEVVAPQMIPTVYYQTPAITVPSIPTATNSEAVVQPSVAQTNAMTTTKTVTTRVLEPSQPTVNTTTVTERPQNHPHGVRTSSASTYSDTTTDSTITPRPQSIRPNPLAPIHTTTIAPVHRVIHRPYTPSGYASSELDYGRRRIYKTDYKYRHYYCCNICKGRWDLHNRSYSCCEWFYGCPVWSLLICGLFFLILLVAFFTLFGLQPSLNPTRYSETAETRLLNRTQIIYGFYRSCGYQTNVTNFTLTTLILCTNTGTTTTARIQLSPFYTVISGSQKYSYEHFLIYFTFFIGLKIYK